MAHFETHCNDCERLLGNRHEDVNRWIDEMFRTLGLRHRRVRHHAKGVLEAQKLFGIEGAKAAIIHIVRDCGDLPKERDYDENGDGNVLGIIIAPEYLMYDGANETAQQKFKIACDKAIADFNNRCFEMDTSLLH